MFNVGNVEVITLLKFVPKIQEENEKIRKEACLTKIGTCKEIIETRITMMGTTRIKHTNRIWVIKRTKKKVKGIWDMGERTHLILISAML